jgi:hypothetical protein
MVCLDHKDLALHVKRYLRDIWTVHTTFSATAAIGRGPLRIGSLEEDTRRAVADNQVSGAESYFEGRSWHTQWLRFIAANCCVVTDNGNNCREFSACQTPVDSIDPSQGTSPQLV